VRKPPVSSHYESAPGGFHACPGTENRASVRSAVNVS
jgi:hypothetical protein